MYSIAIAQVIVMSQRILLMEAKSVMGTPRESQSFTSVTRDTTSLEMQTGLVSLMDRGQGFSQSVFVC